MNRRDLLKRLAGALAAAPVVASAVQAAPPVSAPSAAPAPMVSGEFTYRYATARNCFTSTLLGPRTTPMGTPVSWAYGAPGYFVVPATDRDPVIGVLLERPDAAGKVTIQAFGPYLVTR